MTETWYLLYDGSSPDGWGKGTYCGRTTDKISAYAHYIKCVHDPYSTGSVSIVTDLKIERANSSTSWHNL